MQPPAPPPPDRLTFTTDEDRILFAAVSPRATHWRCYRCVGVERALLSWGTLGTLAVTEHAIGELSLQTIASRWGGGMYRVTYLDRSDGSMRFCGGSQVFSVPGEPADLVTPALQVRAPVAAQPQAAPGVPMPAGGLSDLLTAAEYIHKQAATQAAERVAAIQADSAERIRRMELEYQQSAQREREYATRLRELEERAKPAGPTVAEQVVAVLQQLGIVVPAPAQQPIEARAEIVPHGQPPAASDDPVVARAQAFAHAGGVARDILGNGARLVENVAGFAAMIKESKTNGAPPAAPQPTEVRHGDTGGPSGASAPS